MSQASTHSYQFGDFRVDGDQRVLLFQEKPRPLTPKVFETLLILVENSGRIVNKEELMSRLWPDTFVEEANLTSNIQQLRKSLGDNARQPIYIETVARRGYRFIKPVETEVMNRGIADSDSVSTGHIQAESPAVSANATARSSARPAFLKWAVGIIALVVIAGFAGWYIWTRRSLTSHPPTTRVMVAVLPFQNLTGDASQDYFSDGLTEEMITQLGNLDQDPMGVIARTSVMQYKNTQTPLDQIGRELQIQYVLEGSVRRESDRVRITAQLIQMKDQSHLWSREYDREIVHL